MRILVISNFYPPYHAGGYGVLCYRISEGLRLAGHDVVVLTTKVPSGKCQDAEDMLSETKVIRRLRIVPAQPLGKLVFTTLLNHMSIRSVLGREKPDVIYTFGVDGIGYPAYADANLSGVPTVTMMGDTWLAQALTDLIRFDPWIAVTCRQELSRTKTFLRKALRCLGRVFGIYSDPVPLPVRHVHIISHFLEEALRSVGSRIQEKCTYIPIPLGYPFFDVAGVPVGHSGIREHPLRALFVSRMEEGKGPDTAIKAIAAAVRVGIDMRLTFCGLNLEKMRPTLDTWAREAGVYDRIHYASATTDKALVNLYRTHDVFLFPSRIVEGFGIVCAEAMACGLPIIGSTSGGQQDLILDGQTGFLTAPSDHEKIGQLLAMLSRDRRLVESMSKAALQMVQRHFAPKVLAQIEGSLREVVDGNSVKSSLLR